MDMLIQFIDLYALKTLLLWKKKNRKRRKLHHTYYRNMYVCDSLNLNDILLKKGHYNMKHHSWPICVVRVHVLSGKEFSSNTSSCKWNTHEIMCSWNRKTRSLIHANLNIITFQYLSMWAWYLQIKTLNN